MPLRTLNILTRSSRQMSEIDSMRMSVLYPSIIILHYIILYDRQPYPKFGHISEFMRDTLRWLPVRQRIHYRLSTIVWQCVLGIAPTYLLGLFILTSSCTGRQSLCSASRGDFVVPHARTAIKQHRAFSIVGPSR